MERPKQGFPPAVMLRVSGPDPKGRKMRQHAFFHSRNGVTTLSASGLCLPLPSQLLIITDASLIEPFIRQPNPVASQHPASELPSPFGPSSKTHPLRASQRGAQLNLEADGKAALLAGTKIMALFDSESGVEGWQEAELVALEDVPSASASLGSLLSSHASVDSGGWQLGWHLVSVEKAPLSRGSLSGSLSGSVRSAPTTATCPSLPRESVTYGQGAGPNIATPRGKEVGNGVSLQTQDATPRNDGPFEGLGFEGGGGSPQSRVRIAVLRVSAGPKGRSTVQKRSSEAFSKVRGATVPESEISTQRKPIPRSELFRSCSESASNRSQTAANFWGSEKGTSASNTPSSKDHRKSATLVSAGPLGRGDFLAAIGSPFGALSPGHFANSVSVGVVSNLWRAGQDRAPILLVDMRCLPGMEGGPVLDRSGGVVGLLWRPIRQRNSGAEVQLMITSDALAPVLRPFGIELLHHTPPSRVPSSSPLHVAQSQQTASPRVPFSSPTGFSEPAHLAIHTASTSTENSTLTERKLPTSTPHALGSFHTSEGVARAVETAVSSVVTLAVEDGAWASGVILSATGLILTNAHLIEPWRFVAKPKGHGSRLQPLVRTSAPFMRTAFEEGCCSSEELTDGLDGKERYLNGRSEAGVESAASVSTEETVLSASAGVWGTTQRVTDRKGLSSSAGPRARFQRLQEGSTGVDASASGMGVRSSSGRDQHAFSDSTDRSARYFPASSSQQAETAGQHVSSSSYRPRTFSNSALDSAIIAHARFANPSDRQFSTESQVPSSTEPLDSPASQSSLYFNPHPSTSSLSPFPTASNPPRNYRPVRVRLSVRGAATWQSARVVFVSQGPLDVAVLQLLVAPAGLQPIVPAARAPLQSATAVVIGHGLFGPMTDLQPSVHAGVTSRLVSSSGRAAMLQTTAAVHPGGSGGAVVDANGHLIGLVTSAARHSGGSMLPHLNFSIPVEALKPVFDFASSGGLNVGLLEPLNAADKSLSAVWALAPPPPLPRPSNLPPGRVLQDFPGQKDATFAPQKGAKFAQFLANRGQELLKNRPVRSKL